MRAKTLKTMVTVTGATEPAGAPSMLITTEAVDRDGDVVVASGMDAADYLRNPVVCWSHSKGDLPIATCTRLAVEPGGVRAWWRWLEGDVTADRVANAWRQGIVRAASIGFLPQEAEPRARGGLRFTRWSLVEFSLCSVPSNAQAVRQLKSLGLPVDDDEVVLELLDDDEVDASLLREALAPGLRAGIVDGLMLARRDERVDVDARDVAQAIRSAVHEVVAASVAAETRRAINRLTGRVD